MMIMINYIFHTIADSSISFDLFHFHVYGYNLYAWVGIKVAYIPELFGDKPWFEVYRSIVDLRWSISRSEVFGFEFWNQPCRPRYKSLVSNGGFSLPNLTFGGRMPNPFLEWSRATLKTAIADPQGPMGLSETSASLGSSGATVTPSLETEVQQTSLARIGIPASVFAARHIVSDLPSVVLGIAQSYGIIILVTYLLIKDSLPRLFRKNRR
jgi:hypothetical protein